MFFKEKVDQKQVFKWGFGAGLAEIACIIIVVLVMLGMDPFFKASEQVGGPLAIIAVLMLLVFSAAISGLIVFGYPAYLFLQKQYKQAICTLIRTLLTIAVGFIIVLIIVFFF